ncbi:MAG TPA: Hpt domain-containing protein [Gemmatimonadales bacterium]|nr:Hpt domain-containing protein [Gemmatimonadales bacterium]
MNPVFQRLLPLFLLDVNGSLHQMDEALRVLQRDARNPDAGHVVGRALHTIRGSALMMGCDALAEAARVAELLVKREVLDPETVVTLAGARAALGRLVGGLATQAVV